MYTLSMCVEQESSESRTGSPKESSSTSSRRWRPPTPSWPPPVPSKSSSWPRRVHRASTTTWCSTTPTVRLGRQTGKKKKNFPVFYLFTFLADRLIRRDLHVRVRGREERAVRGVLAGPQGRGAGRKCPPLGARGTPG